MKRALLLLLVSCSSMAQGLMIESHDAGSGTPGNTTLESATQVSNDWYHAPQYLPGFPTAATIWPRVIDVPCVKQDDVMKCKGYEWSPSLGRGEYLFVRPQVETPPPAVIDVQPVVEEKPQRSEPVKKKVIKRKKFVRAKTCTVK